MNNFLTNSSCIAQFTANHQNIIHILISILKICTLLVRKILSLIGLLRRDSEHFLLRKYLPAEFHLDRTGMRREAASSWSFLSS